MQFKKGDKVIINPDVLSDTWKGPRLNDVRKCLPGVFEITYIGDGGHYVLLNVYGKGLSYPKEALLPVPLFRNGNLVQVSLKSDLFGYKKEFDQLYFRVEKVVESVYEPHGLGEDGCIYALEGVSDYAWHNLELKKVENKPISDKDLDELNNLLDECLNDLNNNSNENQLQREDTSVSNRDNEEFSRVHGRRHQARVSINHPKHQKGVRG